MPYYCFLCNEFHEDSPTKEHFIPKSIDGPEHQFLPVCEPSNRQSNSLFDNNVRDILCWTRFQETRCLKRTGEALLFDGGLRPFKFSYKEDLVPDESTAFRYIFDRETSIQMPLSKVYAIAFPIGLMPDEKETFCRGLAKMSLGAIAYLLKRKRVEDQIIRQIFLQASVDALRHFALNLPWSRNAVTMKFSLGRSDVLGRLQQSCENSQIRNHVIKINFYQNNLIHVEGMLYSQYGWMLDILNQVSIKEPEFRLENPIVDMNAPESLRDTTLSPDLICIVNPDFTGKEPNIPNHWRPRA